MNFAGNSYRTPSANVERYFPFSALRDTTVSTENDLRYYSKIKLCATGETSALFHSKKKIYSVFHTHPANSYLRIKTYAVMKICTQGDNMRHAIEKEEGGEDL